jgi:hypothetical protein
LQEVTLSVELASPPGVSVVYVQDPNDVGHLHGVDWSGRASGELRLTGPVDTAAVRPSPDGSRLAVGDVVFDSSGHRIGTVGVPTVKEQAMWADDSRHLCGILDPSGSIMTGTGEVLEYLTPGALPRRVTTIGAIGGQQGSSLVACSAAADRAIVAHSVIDHVDEVLVIRLSTGEELARHAYGQPPSCAPSAPLCGAPEEVSSLTASPDGHVVAENYLDGHAVLHDLASWRVLGRLADMVTRFSWDGRRLITVAGTAAQPSGTVREWATGRILLGPVLANSFLPRPGQPDVMVPVLGMTGRRMLIHGDGTVQRLNVPVGTLLE